MEPFFQCELHELCGVWKAPMAWKISCTFCSTDYIAENRNSKCPFPVELVICNLKLTDGK